MSGLPVRPKRSLGQHFLVDRNILGVIERQAELASEDVVLEVGAGLGVLTDYLAQRVGLVHAVEVDRSLEPHLLERVGDAGNVRLVFGDAMSFEAADFDPSPTKLVSNLPYSIATPVIMESLAGLPTIRRWVVMVQREVADRLLARPETRDYGAVSVLVQLTTERADMHLVARTCFQPPPRVDSALVALTRTRQWGPGHAWVKEVVQAAFLHRRKTLPNSLELAGVATRSAVTRALADLGRSPRDRAEVLVPAEFLALAEALA